MRILRVLTFALAVFTLMCAGSVLAAPTTMSYQGQLRSSTGTPVADGMYSVTFTLWTHPTMGSMIWTETQSVHVEGGEGLFSCQLGSLQPLSGPLVLHSNDDLYLQTAVAGQALLPRQQLGMVPRAVISGTIKSDVDGVGSLDVSLSEDTTKIHATHESFTNLIDSYIHLEDDNVTVYNKCFGAGQPHPQTCDGATVKDDEVTRELYTDEDADGNPEGHAMMRGTSGGLGAVVFRGTWDADDNGVEDFTAGGEVNDTSSQWGVTQTKEVVGGNHRDGWNVICVDGLVRSDIKNKFENGDIPNQEDFVDSRGAFSRAINTKGTGAVVRVAMEATDSATTVLESDSDGDGKAEAKAAVSSVSSVGGGGGGAVSSAYARMSSDSDDDGEDECLAEAKAGDNYAQVRGFKVDIAAKRSSFSSLADSTGAVSLLGRDIDGDAIDDFSSGGLVDDSSAQMGVTQPADVPGNHRDGWNVICVDAHTISVMQEGYITGDFSMQRQAVDQSGSTFRAINTKGTGATVRAAMEATDSGAVVLDSDDDGDGVAEAHGIMICKPGSGSAGGSSRVSLSTDSDEDGEDESLYEAKSDDKFAQVRGFKVDIAESRRSSFGSYSDSAGSVMSIDRDSDNDGVEDVSVGGSVNDTAAQWSVTSVDEGNHRDGWNVVHVDGLKTRTELKQEFQNGDIPNQEDFVDSRGVFSRAINTKGTGAILRVASEATDSAVSVLETDSDGDGHAESRSNIAALLNGNVVIESVRDIDDDGTPDVSAETEVSSDSATFRLTAVTSGIPGGGTSAITMGASSSSVHLEVGAATCDGTNWTNASDRNLKENFREVDGEELLNKVSELPITQWNYKGDSDNKHIGPTAQDFKSTFGVGSDGKSISTIDPSGVALAAIQQLIKENEELRARVAKLEAESAKQAR